MSQREGVCSGADGFPVCLLILRYNGEPFALVALKGVTLWLQWLVLHRQQATLQLCPSGGTTLQRALGQEGAKAPPPNTLSLVLTLSLTFVSLVLSLSLLCSHSLSCFRDFISQIYFFYILTPTMIK